MSRAVMAFIQSDTTIFYVLTTLYGAGTCIRTDKTFVPNLISITIAMFWAMCNYKIGTF